MVDTPGYPSEGQIQDINDHPDMSLPEPGYQPRMQHGVQMAGDVIPIRQGNMDSDIGTAVKQVANERSMRDIAAKGAGVVNTNNLSMYRKKQ